MTLTTIELQFDPTGPEHGRVPTPDGEVLMAQLARLGATEIHLNWAGAAEEYLPIEDDVLFLAMNHDELADFFERSEPHLVYLNDGRLEIVATHRAGIVTMRITQTPLDRSKATEQELQCTSSAYASAWHRLIAQLEQCTRGDPLRDR